MGTFEQKCPLCDKPITRGQTVVVHPMTGAEVHAGCYAFEYSDEPEGSANG